MCAERSLVRLIGSLRAIFLSSLENTMSSLQYAFVVL